MLIHPVFSLRPHPIWSRRCPSPRNFLDWRMPLRCLRRINNSRLTCPSDEHNPLDVCLIRNRLIIFFASLECADHWIVTSHTDLFQTICVHTYCNLQMSRPYLVLQNPSLQTCNILITSHCANTLRLHLRISDSCSAAQAFE